MHEFRYGSGGLTCESVPLSRLVREHGSPLYVYSQKTLTDRFQELKRVLKPLDHRICYSVKSNSNLAVLRLFDRLGSGFDIVSEGELRRVMATGGDPRGCVFAGAGKTVREIEFALRQGIRCFNAESEPELVRIAEVARRLKRVAPVAVRVNPDVAAGTHAKITTGTYANKFGIAFEQVEAIYARAARLKHLRLIGVQMHLGSQLTSARPFDQAVRKVIPLVRKLAAHHDLEFFNIGGGIGIVYDHALASGTAKWWTSPAARRILTPSRYAAALVPLLRPLGLQILVEPGRYLTGNAGVLVTRVEYVKRTGAKTFVIVDAAMNDLVRPAFYDSYHEIVPLHPPKGRPTRCDVVGPICESGDYFAKNRLLPPVHEGDYLALMSAGAYSFTMASTYNSRPLTAEVLVNGRRAAAVRTRQATRALWKDEHVPSWAGLR